MPLQPLTHTRFARIRSKIQRMLTHSPAECTLILADKQTTGKFTDFTGDSERDTISKTLKCAYKRQWSVNEREKYGLKEDVSGKIWISPKDLISEFGTFKLDKRKIIFELYDQKYIVDTLAYISPYYKSCLMVEFTLKDLDKA